jgi:hypothetical protein
MITNTCTKRPIASCYAPYYLQRCGEVLDEALYSVPAYDGWRRFDLGPTSDVFSRLAALPVLTKRDLRAHGPQAFVPHGRQIAEGLAAGDRAGHDQRHNERSGHKRLVPTLVGRFGGSILAAGCSRLRCDHGRAPGGDPHQPVVHRVSRARTAT